MYVYVCACVYVYVLATRDGERPGRMGRTKMKNGSTSRSRIVSWWSAVT